MKTILFSLTILLSSISLFGQNNDFRVSNNEFQSQNPPIAPSINSVVVDLDTEGMAFQKQTLENPPISDLFVSELGYATWDAPELDLNFPFWKQYTMGPKIQSWGLINGGSYDAAIRWEPIQLIGLEDAQVTRIRFFPANAPSATYKLRVYQGENANIIYEQELANVDQNSLNYVILDNPVPINTNLPLWVGYNVTHNAGEYPGGVCEGVENPNSRLFGYSNGNWGYINSDDYSWILSAYVELDGKVIELPNEKPIQKEIVDIKSTTNEIQSYHVYINGTKVGETLIDSWQYYYLEKGETYSAGVSVDYDDGHSELVEYEFIYNPPFDLDISPDTIYASHEPSIKDFEIFSNTSWTANESDFWIDLIFGYGTNDKTNTLILDENTESEHRIGTVTIEGDFAPSCLLTIIQAGVPVPMPLPSDLVVNNYGQATWKAPTHLQGNTLIGYNLYLNGDYFGESEDLIFDYTNLDQLVGYTAGVSAVFLEGESEIIEYDFVINTVNELVIDKTSFIESFENVSESLTISSNTNWTISCEADWVNFSTISGIGNATINIDFDYNEGEVRSTNAIISGTNTSVWKLRMIQAQNASGGTPPPYNISDFLNQETGETTLSWEFNANASGFGFYENFESGTAENFLYTNEGISIEDGYFKINGDGDEPDWILSQYNEIFSDFLFETTFIRKDGNIADNIGVLLRASSIEYDLFENHAYLISLTNDGHNGYVILDGSQWPSVSNWWASEDIQQGLDVPNTLSIHAHGDKIDVYINDAYQYTIKDDTYTSGYNAIGVQNSWYDVEVWFENVSIGMDELNRAEFSNFNVYRNNEFLGETQNTEFNDQLPEYGSYQYQISAMYDDGESDLALSDTVYWTEDIPPLSTEVKIMPTNQDVDSIGLFSTTVEIVNVEDLGHFGLELQYNSSLIHVKSISLDSFITSTGRGIAATTESINNDFGFVEYEIITNGEGIQGPEGAGILLTIDWEVVKVIQNQTITELLLKDVVVLKSDSTNITVDTYDASLNLSPNGILDLKTSNKIDIIPNPNNGFFNIQFNGLQKDFKLYVINESGLVLGKYEIKNLQILDQNASLDLTHLSNGVYVLKLVSDEHLITKKIIIE